MQLLFLLKRALGKLCVDERPASRSHGNKVNDSSVLSKIIELEKRPAVWYDDFCNCFLSMLGIKILQTLTMRDVEILLRMVISAITFNNGTIDDVKLRSVDQVYSPFSAEKV